MQQLNNAINESCNKC